MWQFRMGFMQDLEHREVPQDVETHAVRKLTLQIYLQAVADAKDGDEEARLWLDDMGREVIEVLGYVQLARLDVDELLAMVNAGNLGDALGEQSRHCRDCVFLKCTDGRCRCTKDMWVEQGRGVDYARATVIHDTKGFLKPCEIWRRK